MSLGLLARQPLTWDSEAAAYILQVEAADGQSLEPGVARAINQFVIDCKVRGIWGAIKSCCLLSGARTLNGALRPLKGASPTNFSFTNSDYNRETGLKGNGTNQYLDTNFASSSLGLNNIHFCINLSSFNSNSGPSGARIYIADFGSNAIRSGTGFGQFRVNDINFLSYNEIATTNNFIGISRANSDFFTLRLKNTNTIWLSNSSSSTNVSFRLFGRYNGTTTTEFGDGRISFYSIGESTDLRLLEQCVTSLMQNFLRAISTYSISDTDAANYVRRVELADGFILENAVKIAIDNLVIGLKADGLWTSIKACCIMSGAKSVNGALTPLIGLPPQNINFTNAHYSRTLGLIGENNGFRYLDSRRRNNEDPQNNHHIAVYKNNSAQSLNSYFGSINTNGQDGVGARGQLANVLMTSSRNLLNTSLDSPANFNSGAGLIGIARNNSSSYEVIGNNLTATMNSVSQTPNGTNIGIFARVGGGVNNNTDARLCFYSIGEYLNLSLLDARLDTFMAALSNAGI